MSQNSQMYYIESHNNMKNINTHHISSNHPHHMQPQTLHIQSYINQQQQLSNPNYINSQFNSSLQQQQHQYPYNKDNKLLSKIQDDFIKQRYEFLNKITQKQMILKQDFSQKIYNMLKDIKYAKASQNEMNMMKYKNMSKVNTINSHNMNHFQNNTNINHSQNNTNINHSQNNTNINHSYNNTNINSNTPSLSLYSADMRVKQKLQFIKQLSNSYKKEIQNKHNLHHIPYNMRMNTKSINVDDYQQHNHY